MEIDFTGRGREGLIEEKISLELYDELVVRAAEIPSSGYRWEVAERPEGLAETGLEHEFESKDSAKDLVGAGGTRVLRFQSEDEPHGTLELVCHRPWLEPSEDDRRIVLEIESI